MVSQASLARCEACLGEALLLGGEGSLISGLFLAHELKALLDTLET